MKRQEPPGGASLADEPKKEREDRASAAMAETAGTLRPTRVLRTRGGAFALRGSAPVTGKKQNRVAAAARPQRDNRHSLGAAEMADGTGRRSEKALRQA